MTTGRPFTRLLLQWIAWLTLGLLGCQALAQGDPPARVGRLNHTEGPVTFSPAGDNEWIEVESNRPLTRGDRLWTDKGSRADIQIGSSAVRMDGQTQLEILALDDQAAQLSVTQGTVYVRVRSLPEGENYEVDTPNLAWRAAYPGDYRIDVDAARGTTRVTIHSGTGAVYGETGQALPMGGGQQITFRARTLAQVMARESPPQDHFDRWAAERNRREDQSVSARHVPREVVGYQQLDAYGQWMQDETHGPVWLPQGTVAHWAPYRHGRWEWISPWGWTWIDEAVWGFATSHYGRWALIDARWAWVPGRIGLRPVYAPALVAFVGGSTSAWTLPIAAGRSGVAWFPLAPGEAWQPGFRASPQYIGSVNRQMAPVAGASHAHQTRPEALTAISTEDFNRGKPVKGSWLRVAANVLTKAQVVAPPPKPEAPAVAARERPVPAQAAPPPQADIRQVTATAQQQARLAEQARATEQARQAELTRVAEQAKAAEHARLAQAERARVAQAKAADQARAAELARASAQARSAEQARAASARHAAQARAAQQAKAADQAARKAEQARIEEVFKRERQARRAEQLRREQTAKRPDPPRRAAAAPKREQMAKRAEPPVKREVQARKAPPPAPTRQAQTQRDVGKPSESHALRVEQVRRAAERDAEALRTQRETARREGQERDQAQREAWERQQQALAEQWRRDQQALEQRERSRPRPDLRNDQRPPVPEVWQRGIPILNPGRTS